MDLRELVRRLRRGERRALARAITILEEGGGEADELISLLPSSKAFVVGVTGPPGSGKSTLLGRLAEEFAGRGRRVGVLAIDPSSRITGGALLGDRVRMMDAVLEENVYIRSLATRGSGSLSKATSSAVRAMAAAGRDLIFVETVGVGQQDLEVLGVADALLLVLAAGEGDEIQGLKAGIIEAADIVAVNKADKPEAATLLSGLRIALQGRERPKLVKVSALRGEGVEELADAIMELEHEGGKSARLLKEVLVEKALSRLRAAVEEEAEKYSERVARGALPIEDAVKEIIKHIVNTIRAHEAG